ncbi:hypothetical protein TWF106_002937 [Orbilia oligospora]|uniref:Cleavage/polyadenylation specificity factor A subunit N-terminal domain-containing protein n=1 Tax=Orbilia oligospora TaxID=2813651 RepID=A0A7C8QWL7_ORBOL|nr:hypothetical protein TWF106_002937 [Orbilia oligospora]
MVQIKVDSQLTTDVIPAKPIKAGNRFVAIKDKDSKLACFSLSDEKKLNLILNIQGVHTLIDFGKLIGIETDIRTFDVQQSSNLSLDICIATDSGDNKSNLWLVHKLDVSGISSSVPASNIIRGADVPAVHQIFLSNFESESEYPLILAAFQPLERITREEQVGFVHVADGSLSLNTKWTLDTNSEKIFDVAFGTSPLGEGLFVLYEIGGKRKVQFKIFRGPSEGFVVEPEIPQGEALFRLLHFMAPSGSTITALTSSEYMSPAKPGQVITSKSEGAIGVKDLHIVQDSEHVRIFYTTADESLLYYDTTVTDLSNGSTGTLLTEGNSTRFSSISAAAEDSNPSKTRLNTLLSIDEDGNLTLLQQSSHDSRWNRYPFYHASDSGTLETKGYAVRIQVTPGGEGGDSDEDPSMIPYCSLLVSSSGYIKGLVNGQEVELSQAGIWLRTDATGVLTIVFTTTDVSGQNIEVESFRPGKRLDTSDFNKQQLGQPHVLAGPGVGGVHAQLMASNFGAVPGISAPSSFLNIGDVAKDVWNTGSRTAGNVWRFGEHTAEDVWHGVENAGNTVGRAAGGVIHTIGGLFS